MLTGDEPIEKSEKAEANRDCQSFYRCAKDGQVINIDRQEFEKLLVDWQTLVYSVCLAFVGNVHDAEDLAQDTFVSAWRYRDRYREENPKSWLCTIAANKCRDYLKSRARTIIPTPDEELAPEVGTSPSAEQEMYKRLGEERVKEHCMHLREPYRDIALAYYYQGETIGEIAQRTRQNHKTVATRLYRARDQLKKLIGEEGLIWQDGI